MDKQIDILKITEITFRHFGTAGDRIKAAASIVIENQLVIHEVRIIQGTRRGLFVAYPNKEYNIFDKTGCVYPINDVVRRTWERQILSSYKKERSHAI